MPKLNMVIITISTTTHNDNYIVFSNTLISAQQSNLYEVGTLIQQGDISGHE